MTAPVFRAWHDVRARALLLGQRLDLRQLARSDCLAFAPLAVPAGEQGAAVLFRYGAVVLFNLQPIEESSFLSALAPLIGDPLAEPECETTRIRIDPDADERIDADGVVCLRALGIEHLQIVADALAKSVVLSCDEGRVASAFDRIEPVAAKLGRTGPTRFSSAHLLEHIGAVLATQHRVVGRVEVTEKPDLLWDHPELERLALRLQEEYDLPERERALNRKLDLIAQTATTALTLVQARQSLRVEWYIVVLIVVEICLTLYELFVASHR